MNESQPNKLTRRRLLQGFSAVGIAGTVVSVPKIFATAQETQVPVWQEELDLAKQYTPGSTECYTHANNVLALAGFRGDYDGYGADTAVGAYQTLAGNLEIDGFSGPLTQKSILGRIGLHTDRLPKPFDDGLVILKADRVAYSLLGGKTSTISMVAVAEGRVRSEILNNQVVTRDYHTPTGWFKAGDTADSNTVSTINPEWNIPYFTGLVNSAGTDNGIGIHASSGVYVYKPTEAEIAAAPFQYFSHGCIRTTMASMISFKSDLDAIRNKGITPQILAVAGSGRLKDLESWGWQSKGDYRDNRTIPLLS